LAKVDLLHPRPLDATLTVTRAAEVLGVHANTVRAWSDAGRLRYYRINPRGDRRYRLGDLHRFLAASDASGAPAAPDGDPRAVAPRRRGSAVPSEEAVPLAEHQAMMALAGELSSINASAIRDALTSPDAPLDAALRAIHDTLGAMHVSAWRTEDGRLAPIAISGPPARGLGKLPSGFGVLGHALADPGMVVEGDPARDLSATNQTGREVACAIPGDADPWGVLLIVRRTKEPVTEPERELIGIAATAVGSIVRAAASAADVAHQLQRADALRRVTSDIGSRLDLDEILDRLVDHTQVLFSADRVAAFLFEEDGTRRMAASRGLSRAWIAAVTSLEGATLGSAAIAARRPMFAVHYRDDPRSGNLRAAVIQEGFDTVCIAPLLDGDKEEPLGILGVYHDATHPWSDDQLETMGALATQASVAIKAARNYAQLATWTAQLQSIQQLGTRLNGLTSVKEIGTAIATELRQLIDYHNVRVYRLYGQDLVPVAMQGRVGEYLDETPELLKVQYGAGITGWVAEHRQAQLLDNAAADPRAQTIPGTEDDMDESMLLAPMLFEDQVIGVLVLSKLGLRQFRGDDLRLLEIYASLAAQAMANADATERLREKSEELERKVRGQRELLGITESILTTFEPPVLLGTIADRLGDLIGSDNILIELVNEGAGHLTPVVARGVDAERYLRPWSPGQVELASWVIEHNEPVRIDDQFDDPRVHHGSSGPTHGSLICVPLRGRDRAIGGLTMERVGEGRLFTDDEFELAQLFAAQASVALENAEIHLASSDATERLREKSAALERLVRGQRELLGITDSILSTLDAPVLLGTIADRLNELIGSDNVAIELYDRDLGALSPVVARGQDAEYYLQPWLPGETGIAPWVLEHNEAVRIDDEFDDQRVAQGPSGPVHGSIICVPLRGREGPIGVLTMERLGEGGFFTDDEFELVQLFAAQAAIALQNAEVHLDVRRRAQTDVLTGLMNHGTFGQHMDALIAGGEPFSLVMLDLDRFKPVNDLMGHQAGNLLLRQVADAIVAASRDSDRVFRYGGDEFAVLLPRTAGDQVGPIAERMRAAVKSVVGPGSAWRGRARSLEASAGTASFPADGVTPDEVLLAADRALFVAKRSGGARVASASEGTILTGEFTLQAPTPIDSLAASA
jgi:diguanylate cyclase (GGDEF)-like protein/excisionase family DNA binding protein